MSREALTARADRDLKHSALILLAVSLLAFLGAALVAEFNIRRPAGRVIDVARRLGAGDVGARIGRPYPAGDLGELMEVVDRTVGQVEEQRREIEGSAGLLQAVEDSVLDHMAVLDAAGTIVSTNAAWTRFSIENGVEAGKPAPGTGIGSNYLEACRSAVVTGADDAQRAYEGLRAVLAREIEHFALEYPCHSATQRRWFQMDATPLRISRGGVVVVHANITERKRAQEANERALQRLTEAQRIGQIGDWDFDLATGAISWSAQIFEILGRDAGLGPPKDYEENAALYEPASAALMAEKVATAIASGQAQEYELVAIRPDGRRVPVQAVAVPRKDGAGKVVGLSGTVQDVSARKQAERLVHESEERLSFATEAARIGDWDMDLRTNVARRSLLHDQCFGYTEMVPAWGYDTFLAHVEAADRDRVDAGFRKAMAGEGEYDEEFRTPWPDGSQHWLWTKGHFYFDDTGQPYRVAGIVVDITERKRAEAALRESESEFRAMAESMPQIVWITRPDGWNIYFNQQWMDYTGLTLEESIGHGWNKPFHPDDQQAAWDAWQKATKTSSVYAIESRLRRADGEYRWWLIRGVPQHAAGEIVKWFGTCTDIHDLKTAQLEIALANKAVAASERHFRALVENSSDAINLCDREFRLIYRSPSAARITGYADGERIGSTLGGLGLSEDDAVWRDLYRSILQSPGHAETIRYRIRRKDGAVRWIEGIVTNLLDDPVVGALVVNYRDITDRKLVGERLAESELRFRRILEVNAEPTLMTDEQGIIVLANAASAELLGRAETSLVGSPLGLPVGDGRPTELEIMQPGGELRTAEMRFARARIGEQATLVVSLHDLSERKKYESRIEFLANHDALTGLPNRNLLGDRAEQAISRARRADRQLVLMFIDLDRFKLVNDSWGHPFGDAMLVQMGKRLSETVREGDTVARMGGDEFVILLPELPGADKAIVVADKVLAALARPFEVEGRMVPMTASLGIAAFPADGATLEALLQSADAAMYRAKDLGRAGFQFYSAEMGKSARDRAELEGALHAAIERGELALHYQPQLDLATRRIVGFEALMRWTRPGLGPVSPMRFIPIAEDSDLIVKMGDWALNTACRQAAEWRDTGLGHYRIAVNLSARQFWKGRVAGSVAAALAASGAEPDLLEVEITEGVVLRDVKEVMRSLAELRATGVTVAIDDFGTGYSSLAYLRSLPIDKLKIDKAFLKGTPEDPDACAFVAQLIQLAHVLKFIVVAEGVEQEVQAAFLRSAGCERMQGFLFSPALPAKECGELLRRHLQLTQVNSTGQPVAHD